MTGRARVAVLRTQPETVLEDWRAHTPWGQLFQQVQRHGYLADGRGAS